MIYRHSFRLAAPLERVRDFHAQPQSMSRITPPPIIARIHQAPAPLVEGSQMDFTLWMGPLPLRWQARIENVTPSGFDDRQLSGPFSSWVHRHRFEAVDANTTIVNDEIQAELAPGWFWRAVGALMWLNLPVLFAYRGWRTRRYLEQGR